MSSFSLKLATPTYVTLEEKLQDSTFLQEFTKGNVQGVLKREYSIKAEHDILPTNSNAQENVTRRGEYMEVGSEFVWDAQVVCPTLHGSPLTCG